MNKLSTLKLWALGFGIPLDALDDARFKFDFEANDPHACLHDLKNFTIVNHSEAYHNLMDPKNQLEFICLMRDLD